MFSDTVDLLIYACSIKKEGKKKPATTTILIKNGLLLYNGISISIRSEVCKVNGGTTSFAGIAGEKICPNQLKRSLHIAPSEHKVYDPQRWMCASIWITCCWGIWFTCYLTPRCHRLPITKFPVGVFNFVCLDHSEKGARFYFVLIFWWGTKNFQSPRVPVGDDAGGRTREKISTEANSTPYDKEMTHFWCCKNEIKLSDTVLRQNIVKIDVKPCVVFCLFVFFNFRGQISEGGLALVQNKGTSVRWGIFARWEYPRQKQKTPWGVFNLDDVGFYMSSLQQLSGPLCIVEFGGLTHQKVVLNHAHCVDMSNCQFYLCRILQIVNSLWDGRCVTDVDAII